MNASEARNLSLQNIEKEEDKQFMALTIYFNTKIKESANNGEFNASSFVNLSGLKAEIISNRLKDYYGNKGYKISINPFFDMMHVNIYWGR